MFFSYLFLSQLLVQLLKCRSCFSLFHVIVDWLPLGVQSSTVLQSGEFWNLPFTVFWLMDKILCFQQLHKVPWWSLWQSHVMCFWCCLANEILSACWQIHLWLEFSNAFLTSTEALARSARSHSYTCLGSNMEELCSTKLMSQGPQAIS